MSNKNKIRLGVSGLISCFALAGCFPTAVVNSLSRNSPNTLAEVKTYLGSMSRAQQAYYLETGTFAETLEDLQIGIPDTVGLYKLAIARISNKQVIMTADPGVQQLPHLAVGVFLSETAEYDYAETIMCQGKPNVEQAFPYPRLIDGVPSCPKDAEEL